MRPSSRTSSPTSGFSKLPPIITSPADREFLQGLGAYIDKEISKVDPQDEEQRYLVYKSAFNQVIDYCTAYKPILTSIKREYEETIEAIKKGQREAVFLQGKLKAMASEPTTLRNYKRRADQLEENLTVVKRNNAYLSEDVDELVDVIKERQKKEDVKEETGRQLKKDSRRIPGLTLEESTDLNILNRKYDKLDRQLKELNISFKTRYVSKARKVELKEMLDSKVAYRDQLLWQSQVMKAKAQRLKVAVEAAHAYNRVKPPHQTVGDAVTLTLQHYMRSLGLEKAAQKPGEEGQGREGTPSSGNTFEDDDPTKEKEAEMMLEYIEKFNELFEDGKYEEAAIHAANSPKGILRTQATLAKFRDVKVQIAGRSPLLAFCDTLMSSVKAAASKPDEGLSMDCVSCGLNENRLDLLYHWIAQEWLTLSVGLGNMIRDHCKCNLPCKCGCQALAQGVYQRIQAHPDAVASLLRQGRVKAGLEYAGQHDLMDHEFLGSMAAACPSLPLLAALCPPRRPALPLGTALRALLQADHVALAVQFLQQLQKQTVEAPAVDYDPLRHSVVEDNVTDTAGWNDVIKRLQRAGHAELSLRVAAAAVVGSSLRDALRIVRPPTPPPPTPPPEPEPKVDVTIDVREPTLVSSEVTADELKVDLPLSSPSPPATAEGEVASSPSPSSIQGVRQGKKRETKTSPRKRKTSLTSPARASAGSKPPSAGSQPSQSPTREVQGKASHERKASVGEAGRKGRESPKSPTKKEASKPAPEERRVKRSDSKVSFKEDESREQPQAGEEAKLKRRGSGTKGSAGKRAEENVDAGEPVEGKPPTPRRSGSRVSFQETGEAAAATQEEKPLRRSPSQVSFKDPAEGSTARSQSEAEGEEKPLKRSGSRVSFQDPSDDKSQAEAKPSAEEVPLKRSGSRVSFQEPKAASPQGVKRSGSKVSFQDPGEEQTSNRSRPGSQTEEKPVKRSGSRVSFQDSTEDSEKKESPTEVPKSPKRSSSRVSFQDAEGAAAEGKGSRPSKVSFQTSESDFAPVEVKVEDVSGPPPAAPGKTEDLERDPEAAKLSGSRSALDVDNTPSAPISSQSSEVSVPVATSSEPSSPSPSPTKTQLPSSSSPALANPHAAATRAAEAQPNLENGQQVKLPQEGAEMKGTAEATEVESAAAKTSGEETSSARDESRGDDEKKND